MRNLQRILLFIVGVCIPFNNVAFALAGRSWSLGLISTSLYFCAMLPSLHKILKVNSYYGRFVWCPIIFAVLLITANISNANYYGTPWFPTTILMCCVSFLVMLIHNMIDKGVLKLSIYGLALGALIISLLFVLGIGIEAVDNSRFVLFGENANVLGIYMCLGGIVVFNDFILADKLKMKKFRFLWLLAFVPISALLLATASRVAFISFAVSIFIAVAFLKTERVYIKILVWILFFVIGVMCYKLIVTSDFVILERLLSAIEEGNISGRDRIFKNLWPHITQNFMFGVGQTGYVDISRDALGRVYESGNAVYGYSPHNVLLELLIYTGIWGLFIYLFFWLRTFALAVSSKRKENTVLQILLLIPVAGSILSGQILAAKWAYLIYAFIIASGINIFSVKLNKKYSQNILLKK